MTLARLVERFPQAVLRMEPDKALRLSGIVEPSRVAEALRESGAIVLEFTENKRDLEDYFVELMDQKGASAC